MTVLMVFYMNFSVLNFLFAIMKYDDVHWTLRFAKSFTERVVSSWLKSPVVFHEWFGLTWLDFFHLLYPGNVTFHPRSGSTLDWVMAWNLLGAKPLPELIATSCKLDPHEHILNQYHSKFSHFHSRKCNWYCRLPKWWPLCRDLNCVNEEAVGLKVTTS